MLTFSATSEGRSALNLPEMMEFVFDQFRRTVESELQMIEVTARG
jgi:hypothetical protein